MTLFADGNQGGGLFQCGTDAKEMNHRDAGLMTPGLPCHGETDNQDPPVGDGVLLLFVFGTAYALKKRKESE